MSRHGAGVLRSSFGSMGDEFSFQIFQCDVPAQGKRCLSLCRLMVSETAFREYLNGDCPEKSHAYAYRGIEMHLSPPERQVGGSRTEDPCPMGSVAS